METPLLRIWVVDPLARHSLIKWTNRRRKHGQLTSHVIISSRIQNPIRMTGPKWKTVGVPIESVAVCLAEECESAVEKIERPTESGVDRSEIKA